jgi:hypothetical protein
MTRAIGKFALWPGSGEWPEALGYWSFRESARMSYLIRRRFAVCSRRSSPSVLVDDDNFYLEDAILHAGLEIDWGEQSPAQRKSHGSRSTFY